MSEGKLIPESRGEELGGEISRGCFELASYMHDITVYDVDIDAEKVQSYVLQQPSASEWRERGFKNFPTSAVYSPLLYLPQALGMATVRGFGGSTWAAYARTANFLAYLILGALALALIPLGKEVLCLFLLLPTTTGQAASLSADSLTNALVILFITFIFNRRASSSAFGRQDIGWLIFLGLCLSLVKPTYLVFLLLYFLLPSSKFAGKGKYWLGFAVLCLVSCATSLLWLSLVDTASIVHYYWQDVAPGEQLSWIISHPADYLMVLVRTFEEKGISFATNMVGWFGFTLGTNAYAYLFPPWVAIAFLGSGLFLALTGKKNPTSWSAGDSLVILMTVVLSIIAISSTLYLLSSPVGDKLVQGLQGRYFFSSVALLFLFVAGLPGFHTLSLTWFPKGILIGILSIVSFFEFDMLDDLWKAGGRRAVEEFSPHQVLEGIPTIGAVDQVRRVTGAVTIRGWASQVSKNLATTGKVKVILFKKQQSYAARTEKELRDDVAEHFGDETYKDSGFWTFAELEGVPPGTYSVGVEVVTDEGTGFFISDKQIQIE